MSLKTPKEVRFQGTPVSEGIAIGRPHFLKAIEDDIPDFAISLTEVDDEVARYRKALFSSKKDLTEIKQDLVKEGSDEAIDTIETHIQMLDDPIITTDMVGKIRKNLRNTESVFHSVMKDYETRFTERSDSFFQERLIDVKDVSKRILGHLRDKQDALLCEIPAKSIVFAEEIAPSISAAAHAAQIGAFVTKNGGGTSHSALIARSKGIPFIADIDTEEIKNLQADIIIVDGFKGIIIADPSEETLANYEKQQKQLATRYQFFLEQDHLAAKTEDGVSIKLFINVGNPHDLDAFPYRHDGVGLFRTEYLFLQTKEFFPTENYQEKAYRHLIEKMGSLPVVIRVFDLGGDKNPSLFFGRKAEPNPALGNRGIRFLLRDLKLFKIQLRAIFKAAIGADVRLLLPLISDIRELYNAKTVIAEVRDELRSAFSDIPDLPIGCMIEVPSAVMICDALAQNCDFLSLGTNDLVQYTLGVDRSNPAMSELYYPAHPSVLRMIKMICVEAKKQKTPLTICGEIASNTLFTPLLLGLGLRELSLSPRYVPHIKQAIRKWTLKEANMLAKEILQLADPEDISSLLTKAQKK
ncbi:MAG: Phosphoenolpyruvate-protein phosphotransferase [Chlamydiae bacterium]|nr:Phosphoenolpyruvate-protein phosphotransferase [Chlamydiota bacterium]